LQDARRPNHFDSDGFVAPLPALTGPKADAFTAVMNAETRARKLVVAGVIIDGPRVLLSQRRADQPLPLQWEFPGGKVEPGESPEAALRRELGEELAVEVRVGRIWDALFHPYPDFDLIMLVYPCQLVGAAPRCVQVADLRWCLPTELAALDVLSADTPLVARLAAEGPPPAHLTLQR
jgi:8-oxo-dGTP diphosphatase